MTAKQIEIIKQPRLKVLEILNDFMIEQLNVIPAGYNNNLIWNLGHMVATDQAICYKRAGQDTWVNETFFEAYKPGSKPEKFVTTEELDEIKSLFVSSLEQLKKDYDAHLFSNYPAWTTRYGVEITSIENAIAFLPFHEGLHIGYIMAMRKLV
ncbi:DinB family protein [Mucilaginibacter glaciei]|uniref:DinB family protein n=1 Tax=Mucilaginibacter glaciei TaxID=2772109 RepID=A0A926S2D1_9SPHI|nr:DinB family protein [Mucilaginibacter glaciei]MBD1393084.1 DinB family protein [Mucilaginibacter glaciei]